MNISRKPRRGGVYRLAVWFCSLVAFAIPALAACAAAAGIVWLAAWESKILCSLVTFIVSDLAHTAIRAPWDAHWITNTACLAVLGVILVLVAATVRESRRDRYGRETRKRVLFARTFTRAWRNFWSRLRSVVGAAVLGAFATVLCGIGGVFVLFVAGLLLFLILLAAMILTGVTIFLLDLIPGVAIEFPPVGFGGWIVFGIWFVVSIPLVIFGMASLGGLTETGEGRAFLTGLVIGSVVGSSSRTD